MSSDVSTVEVRPKRSRKLRIAWSVGWSVLAVLFCVMWVRSYWWSDHIQIPRIQNRVLGVGASMGVFGIADFDRPNAIGPIVPWKLITTAAKTDSEVLTRYGFGYCIGSDASLVHVSFWIPVLLSSTLAMVPWLPWSQRFSLRALLIATTLIAAVLGLTVWALR